jgi:hypothetical protein
LPERVSRIEWEQEAIHSRLNDGARTFAEITQTQKELHEEIADAKKPVPLQWWKVAGLILTILVLVVTWVWQAAKYPDREEFNRARQATEERAKGHDKDLSDLKLEQVKIQSGVKAIKDSQARTEKSMDEIKTDIKALANPKRRR